MKIISGNSNISLSNEIASSLGVSLMSAQIQRFPDKEIFVEIHETVRGEDVFIIQPMSYPANDNIMELLIMIDALKRGSAKQITAVIPYYGYARQDRKTGPRTPISAKLMANLITTSGASRILTMDLHSAQIHGFFDIPVDNLLARPVFYKDINNLKNEGEDFIVVAPDVGAVISARELAKNLNTDLAVVDKRRERPGVSKVMNIIGDVRGRNCILLDDMIDSGGSICNASYALREQGALDIRAYATHGILSELSVDRLEEAPLKEVVITNSILMTEKVAKSEKIRQISIAPLLAEAIQRISEERSVSSLFNII